jgi:hypothetical protein
MVVPGFAAEFRRSPLRLPALERLFAYARTARRSDEEPTHDRWQTELLAALGLETHRQYPSAPLSQLGSMGTPPVGATFHADPIRMEMSGEGLSLQSARPWTAVQREEVADAYRRHLSESPIDLEIANDGLFVTAPELAAVETVSVQNAEQRPLRDALPRGTGAADLRRLMAEIQMLMHDSYSAPDAANGVWLWGNGTLEAPSSRRLPELLTNDAYARGIYLFHEAGSLCRSQPSSFDAMSDLPARTVVVLRDLSLHELESRWFAPALTALDGGRLHCIEVQLDGYGLTARRSLWQRVFARPRPLTETLS